MFLSLLAAATAANAESRGGLPTGKSSAVTVFINDKTGAHVVSGNGFVVDEGGMIATSCRLLTKWLEKVEYSISVELETGAVYPMEHVVSNNCSNNLAMINIRARGLPAAKIAAGYRPKTGDRISVISMTPDAKTVVSNGVIKSVREKTEIFQLDLNINRRQDGSPVFNHKGEIVGILTFPRKERRHIAVPAKNILKELTKCRVLVKELPPVEGVAAAPIVPPPPKAVAPVKNKETAKSVLRDSAEREFSRASSYERSSMYKEAIEAYKQALKLKPDYVDAYLKLGLDYYRLGRYSDAVGAYKNALKINPKDHAAYAKLAATYILLGEYPLAIRMFKESLKTDPRNPETHFNLGVACIISGDKDGAINEYTILRDLDKDRADKLLDLIY